jgi:hypothetical protein
VPGEVQFADDLRAEQRHDVRADRDLVAGEDLLGHRGAAQDVAPLENEDAASCARQIGRVDEPVVPAADYDRVVLHYEPAIL